ncbi:hypothetical protein [Candidatus Aalborgicola defluviihabitans]|uniref:hypothetical protein n=1 Tax=Candidatus Aalborgicola defluviihabitans TaxID=3386187 RepID=UPI001D868C16|nr:hypothetical protein [Burkholderiales bacterium]
MIPLIAAASAPLTGGTDGDPTQTWTVRSTVLGALADWAWLASAPTPWAHAPATVDLSPGGIAFEVGDSVAFDIEGGALRWRRDAGSWTTADLYGAAPLDLGDGLHLTAAPGAAPSFLGGRCLAVFCSRYPRGSTHAPAAHWAGLCVGWRCSDPRYRPGSHRSRWKPSCWPCTVSRWMQPWSLPVAWLT